MAALQQDQAAAAGGIEMAEAEGGGEGEGEPMDTSDPLAYELSAALRAIASLLGLDAAAAGSAAELAAVVGARVQELLAQLPASFFEPLLPAGSLSEAQVGAPRCKLNRLPSMQPGAFLASSQGRAALLSTTRCLPPVCNPPLCLCVV